ncbi:hypothetical protein TWF718_009559 [Orbilia javanica]|uniref:Uncharacterized protein n=1 Tax=Orbilia javanica TaxID=47235 RepID=A0AAN8MKF4_9PEZI
MAAITGMQPSQSTNIQLSENEERASLEKLLFLRDTVRSGQHPTVRPKNIATAGIDGPNTNNVKSSQPVTLNGKQNGTIPSVIPTPSNTIDTAARPIPVFTGSLKGETNGGRAVITVSGKDSAPHPNNGRDQRDLGRQQQRPPPQQQQQQQQHQQQQQLPLNQPQWDHNQQWIMPPGQNQMQGNPEDMNAFAQHLSMLGVPQSQNPFELPPGFPLLPVPHLLPGQTLPGQALPGQPLPQSMPLTNQAQLQPEPMVVDKPPVVDARNLEKKEREAVGNNKQQQVQQVQQNGNNQTSQAKPVPSTATDLQASLKKAQEYAATLPPKPTPGAKQNAVKQPQQDKNRNSGVPASSPMTPTFPTNTDRRDDEKAGFQARPQRDQRQYGDKRAPEPLRKTAMNNNHNTTKEERRDRERDRQVERERERERAGDRWQGRDNRGFDFKKRRSSSPLYDESPTNKGPGFAAPPPPSRPTEATGINRAYDYKPADLDEGDESTMDAKKRANPKDPQKQQQLADKKSSPQPAKREAPPLSPVVTIPRGSPTLEPLSPGKAARYGIPPQDRYAKQQPGYFRYRDPYPPPPHMMGYARGPYEAEYGYPPPRDPRPVSPRRVYLPEGRGYAQEYVYQDAYHDPYYPYPARRAGSPPPPPPPRVPRPQYRYEDEELQRPPRGRSPSPRAAGRMPTARPRRSSRSMSPSRERPTPRASAAPAEPIEEPRADRALIRASDVPHYADYAPYPRSIAPYDAYGDPYNRPVIIRERVPVYVTRVVYVDSNDPEGRPYRPRSPGYPASHAAPPPHGPSPPSHAPPPMRRYVEDPDVMMSDRVYRERDYDYGPYDRGYGREYAREYPHPPPLAPPAHHHHPSAPPPQSMRDGYSREYAMAPPAVREEERERVYREREYGVGNPPMGASRDVEDGRLPYGRDRGMAPPAAGGVRYA